MTAAQTASNPLVWIVGAVIIVGALKGLHNAVVGRKLPELFLVLALVALLLFGIGLGRPPSASLDATSVTRATGRTRSTPSARSIRRTAAPQWGRGASEPQPRRRTASRWPDRRRCAAAVRAVTGHASRADGLRRRGLARRLG